MQRQYHIEHAWDGSSTSRAIGHGLHSTSGDLLQTTPGGRHVLRRHDHPDLSSRSGSVGARLRQSSDVVSVNWPRELNKNVGDGKQHQKYKKRTRLFSTIDLESTRS
eukprot:sb/3477634/